MAGAVIALCVITDGRREHVETTVNSASLKLDQSGGAQITERWMYDDSGDDDNQAWLEDRFPDFTVWQHDDGRQGFGGAIREVWRRLRSESDADYVFHLEDDFTFNRPVPLAGMANALDHHPDLAQLALLRQPWNAIERAAGGIVQSRPGDFQEVAVSNGTYLAHRAFFTTNPSLYAMDLVRDQDWPEGPDSEGRFTHQLLADEYRFGYWGTLSDGEWVRHNGTERNGTRY